MTKKTETKTETKTTSKPRKRRTSTAKKAAAKTAPKRSRSKKASTKKAPAKAKRASKPKKPKVGAYPFRTKREIANQLSEDDSFVNECLLILHDRQTADEQAGRNTKGRNRRGFMSSHAVHGSKLAESARDGGLSKSELSEARELVQRYTRQLAQHFREERISSDPALAKVAKVYSAN